MSFSPFRWLRSFIGALWWTVDTSRRLVMNLVFLGLVVLLVMFLTRSGPVPLSSHNTLVLNLRGPLVEQRSVNPRSAALSQLGAGEVNSGVQLRDVTAALDSAAKDGSVTRALLLLDQFEGAGQASMRELTQAIQRFQASGKPVIAWGRGFTQRQYFVAAQADRVYMHPMGLLSVQGLGGHQNYYREALDRLGVSVALVRAGEYKNAAEPFVANEPSPESLEASQQLYGDLWARYTRSVESARKLPEGSVAALIDQLPERLKASGGDLSRLVLDHKLVDGLMTQDELRELLRNEDKASIDGDSFRQVGYQAYLGGQVPALTGAAVGVVVAEGAIVDGAAPAGTVGGSPPPTWCAGPDWTNGSRRWCCASTHPGAARSARS